MQYTHILAPTDLSDPSRVAFKTAVQLAQTFNARLTLLHVVISAATQENVDWKDAAKMHIGLADREDIQARKKELDAWIAHEVPEDVTCDTQVLYGEAADEIAAAARHDEVDLIVMATQGRSGWRRLVFGSVAADVLKQAPCHVLCIPRPRD